MTESAPTGRPGRPKVPAELARRRVNLSITPADLAEIDRRAKKAGLDRSTYMVRAALDRQG